MRRGRQSMSRRGLSTSTDVAQTHQLADAGAGIVESRWTARRKFRAQGNPRADQGIVLSVDLQENYKIADRSHARGQDSLQPGICTISRRKRVSSRK